MDEGLAKAINGRVGIKGREPGSMTEVLRIEATCEDQGLLGGSGMMDQGMLFGYCTYKAYCACGAIAELDASVISLKKRLGKDVECPQCRNRRISMEQTELREIYSETEEGWLYY